MDNSLDRQGLDEFEAPAITASASTHVSAMASETAAPRPPEPTRDAPSPQDIDPAPSIETPPREPAVPVELPSQPSEDTVETADIGAATGAPVSARIPTLVAYAAPQDVPENAGASPDLTEAHDVPAEPAVEIPAGEASAAPSSPAIDEAALSVLDPASARIIPFVPKGGIPRELPPGSPALPSQPFARQPIPYFISPADGGPAVSARTPAMPPPPSGFRRSSDWARQRTPAAPQAAAAAPVAAVPVAAAVEMPVAASAAAPTGPAADPRKRFNARLLVKRIFAGLGLLLLAYATLVVGLVVAYRWVDPPMSTLMLGQSLGGTEIGQEWAPLEKISPNLQLAVVLSEDARFCTHHGVDWGELKDAITQSLDGFGARGGSTISMQTVKNLFLWPSKSYVRKAVEIPLAMGAEMAWPKARMLEIYLNIAEWGPGIFGAEAAARYHFGKSAANLDAREAALLAVSLPNPFDRQAGNPGPGTQRLADTLQSRMRRAPNTAVCGKTARAGQLGVAGNRRR